MSGKDDQIVMKKGELPEDLAKRIEEKQGKIKQVLDESGNVLKGWGYPQGVPNIEADQKKLRKVIESEDLVKGWGYPQDIPHITGGNN